MSDNNTPYAFIGDLHGRLGVLEEILERDKTNKYHYVFMGDILHHKPFFRRTARTSPIRMLAQVYELVSTGRGTLILGNNENYILRNLINDEEKIKKKEVKYTMKCLRKLPLAERVAYVGMLSNAPTHLELDGKYRLAHAYYPHENITVSRNQIIHGPGYLWFKDEDLATQHNIAPHPYQYYFGHYGLPYRRQNVNVIDATSVEAVGVYYTDTDEFVVQY